MWQCKGFKGAFIDDSQQSNKVFCDQGQIKYEAFDWFWLPFATQLTEVTAIDVEIGDSIIINDCLTCSTYISSHILLKYKKISLLQK